MHQLTRPTTELPSPWLFPPNGFRLFGAFLLTCLVFTAGCTAVLDTSRYNFSESVTNTVVEGTLFKHRVITKAGMGRQLHVYIEGDGRPWSSRITRAEDPTPARALTLDLMSMDESPAIYLGRPCYFLRRDAICEDDRWWTSHRYSEKVVESMNHVLDKYAGDYDSVRLVGHSGGGTLAYLMTAAREDVDALVTLAANLNVSMWVRQHRYAPLYASLSPAKLPPLPASVRQAHYLGSLDTNVRPDMIRSVVAQQPSATVHILPGLDHVCCWDKVWPEILEGSSW